MNPAKKVSQLRQLQPIRPSGSQSNESSLASESERVSLSEFKESSLRRESTSEDEEVSQYETRPEDQDYQPAPDYDKSGSTNDRKVDETSTQTSASSYQYQVTSANSEPSSAINEPVKSESRGFEQGGKLIPAL